MKALEYMSKIANESEYETETCTIDANPDGDIVIVLKTKKSQLTITAGNRISYMGTGPHTKRTKSIQ
jgi:hypothetical protein